MRRSIIHNPEHLSCLFVGGLTHHLIHKTTKGSYPALRLTPSEELHLVDIECGKVSPGSQALILMFYPHGRIRLSWIRDMTSSPRLNTGLLICAHNKFVIFKLLAIPNLLIKIKDPPRFDGELRISRKNPGSMLPGPDSILIEPSPHGATAQCCYQTGVACVSSYIRRAPTGYGDPIHSRKFTGDRFDLNDEIWGEKTEGDPVEDVPPILRGDPRRIVFATC